MKKFLIASILFTVIFVTGCSTNNVGKTVVTNTSLSEPFYMERSLFVSMLNVKDDFVVLELLPIDISNYENGIINSNNRYLDWLFDGICYFGDKYECGENVSVNDSRLNIYYGNAEDLISSKVDKSNPGERAIRFYSRGEISKTITISNLIYSAGSKDLEDYFRTKIVEGLIYQELELGKLKYFKSVDKVEVIDGLEEYFDPKSQETVMVYPRLEELVNSKESFILLVTSKKESGQEYCIFSDYGEEDEFGNYECMAEDTDSDPYATNICSQHSGEASEFFASIFDWFASTFGNTDSQFATYCELYTAYMNQLAGKHGIKYYTVNVNTLEEQRAIERHSFLIGSPQISLFVAGDEQTIMYGAIDKGYIENTLLTWGVVDTNIDMGLVCQQCSEQLNPFNVNTYDDKANLTLQFSDSGKSGYFISYTSIDVNVSNFESEYSYSHLQKEMYPEQDIYQMVFERNIEVIFPGDGTYYLYMYNEDGQGNSSVKSYTLNVDINYVDPA